MNCTLEHGDQRDVCIERVDQVDHAMRLVRQACDTIAQLEGGRVAQFDQMDLWAPPPGDDVIEFWRGVHRACGREFRRLVHLFWTKCPHSECGGVQ